MADVSQLPAAWARQFGLVVEIRTLQSLPLDQRAEAAASIAATVAPGGRIFLHGLFRDDRRAAAGRGHSAGATWPRSPVPA